METKHVVTTVSDMQWNRKPGNVPASVAMVTEIERRWSLLGNLPSRKLVSRRESKETDHFWFAFQAASAEKMVAILRQEQLVFRFTLRFCFPWWTVAYQNYQIQMKRVGTESVYDSSL